MTDQATQKATSDKGSKAQKTEYVVLKQNIEGSAEGNRVYYTIQGHAEGVNAQAAIKAVAGTGDGTFIAIPERSWKPKTRKVETVEQEFWS